MRDNVTNNSFAVTLNGSVGDDGWPYHVTNINWSVVSSNGPVTFTNTHTAVTQVTFANSGTYVLQLAGDDGFATSTATCTITIRGNPAVAILWPTNLTVIGSNTVVPLQAGAIDPSGVITSVQFFDTTNGATYSLGVATQVGNSTNYALAWTTTNVLAGTNLLKAAASDNNGLSATSSVVSVIINSPPTVNAGPNVTNNSFAVTLNGSVGDDGWPYHVTNIN